MCVCVLWIIFFFFLYIYFEENTWENGAATVMVLESLWANITA